MFHEDGAVLLGIVVGRGGERHVEGRNWKMCFAFSVLSCARVLANFVTTVRSTRVGMARRSSSIRARKHESC